MTTDTHPPAAPDSTPGTDAPAVSAEPPVLDPRGAKIKDLSGVLGRRPTPIPAPPATAPAAEPPPVTPAPAAAAAPAPQANPRTRHPAPRETRTSRPGPAPSPRSAATTGSARGERSRGHTVFYVTIDTNEQVRARARQDDLTNAEIIFDAIEATRPELAELLSPDYTAPGSGQLFARPDRRPGKKVQLSAIISDRNLAAIDTLIGELGAESRSHLVEAALTAYFQTRATA